MAHDVFISYSSRDKPIADAVCAKLEAAGVRCWIAPRDVVAGQNWGQSIVGAIKGAQVMVLIFSANANFSPQIARELERAASRGLPIIPLRIEDVKPAAALEYYISTAHWLDAITPPIEEHIQKLITIVLKIIGRENIEAKEGRPNFSAEKQASSIVPNQRKFGKIALWLTIPLTACLLIWWLLPREQLFKAEAPVISSASVPIKKQNTNQNLPPSVAAGQPADKQQVSNQTLITNEAPIVNMGNTSGLTNSIQLNPQMLWGMRLHFSSASGDGPHIYRGILVLNRDGTISGNRSINEQRWSLSSFDSEKQSHLVFRRSGGLPSIEFNVAVKRGGKMMFQGFSLSDRNSQYWLTEVTEDAASGLFVDKDGETIAETNIPAAFLKRTIDPMGGLNSTVLAEVVLPEDEADRTFAVQLVGAQAIQTIAENDLACVRFDQHLMNPKNPLKQRLLISKEGYRSVTLELPRTGARRNIYWMGKVNLRQIPPNEIFKVAGMFVDALNEKTVTGAVTLSGVDYTKSATLKNGAFYFLDVPSGMYWLSLASDEFSAKRSILNVTTNIVATNQKIATFERASITFLVHKGEVADTVRLTTGRNPWLNVSDDQNDRIEIDQDGDDFNVRAGYRDYVYVANMPFTGVRSAVNFATCQRKLTNTWSGNLKVGSSLVWIPADPKKTAVVAEVTRLTYDN